MASTTLMFSAGSMDGDMTPCITVTITDDNVLEGDETFTVALTVSGSTVTLGNAETVVTITDNEGQHIFIVVYL